MKCDSCKYAKITPLRRHDNKVRLVTGEEDINIDCTHKGMRQVTIFKGDFLCSGYIRKE